VEIDIIFRGLFAPAILFFILGMVTIFVKSDLEIPPAVIKGASVILLLSIGLEAGIEGLEGVKEHPALLTVILVLAVFAILLSALTAILSAKFLEGVVKFKTADAWATAGLYGAVSSATLFAAVSIVTAFQEAAPGEVIYGKWMPALNVFLDAPGVIAAIFFGRLAISTSLGSRDGVTINKKELLRDAVFGWAIWLMICGMVVGVLAQMFSPRELERTMKLFDDMFRGVLAIFLLEMGMVAARRLGEMRELGSRIFLAVAAAFGLPQVWAFMAIAGTYIIHLMFPGLLAWGDAFVFAAMAGSASYISAPPAMRAALPEANPSVYLGMSVALTFPFNIIVSLPFWAMICRLLWGA